jgi:hypothetical protein
MKRVIALFAVTAALLAATGCTTVHVKDVDQGKIDRMVDTLASEDPK